MLEVNNIYNMDCIEGLRKLPNKCIDMAITSPPYFKLRDYGVVGQIGQENTCDEYINNLVSVFNEVYRVLKDNGSCWVNIDDVYNNQSLMCIPDKFKIKMIENGWICRNEIIWHKPNSMPSSAKTRFNNDYEKMFFFTKTNDYYFETQYEPFKSTCSKNTQIRKGKSKYSDEEQEKSVRQGMSKNRGSKIIEVRKHLPTQDKFVTFMRSRTSVEQLSANSDIRKTKIEHWFRKDKCGFSYPCVDDWNKIKHLVDDFSEEFMEIDFGITQVDYETDDILKKCR